MQKSYITVRTSFAGQHRYKDAPEEVNFLREFHRHKFFVCVSLETRHNDRELEFMMVLRRLNDYLKKFDKPFELSCENIAKDILEGLLMPLYGDDRRYGVDVSEDMENSGGIVYEPEVK